MIYSIETTKNGYVETLELDGVKYYKSWNVTGKGSVCNDDDFCDQLENNGETDEMFLNDIYDKLDGSFLPYDLWEIEETR